MKFSKSMDKDHNTLEELVMLILGEIEPVADSAIDNERLERIRVIIRLIESLQDRLKIIAKENHDSSYGSVQKIVKVIEAYENEGKLL